MSLPYKKLTISSKHQNSPVRHWLPKYKIILTQPTGLISNVQKILPTIINQLRAVQPVMMGRHLISHLVLVLLVNIMMKLPRNVSNCQNSPISQQYQTLTILNTPHNIPARLLRNKFKITLRQPIGLIMNAQQNNPSLLNPPKSAWIAKKDFTSILKLKNVYNVPIITLPWKHAYLLFPIIQIWQIVSGLLMIQVSEI